MSERTNCAICGSVATRAVESHVCGQLDCLFGVIARVRTKPTTELEGTAEAERRGARCAVRHMLAGAVINAGQAELEMRAIEAGLVRFEEEKPR